MERLLCIDTPIKTDFCASRLYDAGNWGNQRENLDLTPRRANIYAHSILAGLLPTARLARTGPGLRDLQVSPGGGWIAFVHGSELYVFPVAGE